MKTIAFALLSFSFLGANQSFADPTVPKSPLVAVDKLLSEDTYTPIFLGKDFNGGDSVGGGDTIDARKHAAWFYGESKVDVCFHVTQSFGLDRPQVSKVIENVATTWKKYFSDKNIGKNLAPENQINLNFNLKVKCEGGEDLVLYFGTGPIFANLSDLRARQYLSRPVAYVNKTHMAYNLKWSKGYIRFVEPFLYQHTPKIGFPNWRKGSASNVLLHEWGHILGFDHREGTIMDKDIAPQQFISEGSSEIKSVDGKNELFQCSSCPETYQSVSNNFKLKTIKLMDGQVEMTGEDGKVSTSPMKHLVEGESFLSLYSFFMPETYRQKQKLAFFADHSSSEFGQNSFFFKKTNGSLKLIHNGQMAGEFKKVEVQ